MQIMASFNFHFRGSSRSGCSEGSIFIRLIHNRKVKEITTDYRIFPDEWDSGGNTLKIPDIPNDRTRHLLDTGERMQRDTERIKAVIHKLENVGHYSLEEFKSLFVSTRSDMLTTYTQVLVRRLEDNGQYRTARAYLTVMRGLLRFCNQPDLPLDRITAGLMRRYEQSMKDNGKCMNTISFYTRNLRAIYHKAIEDRVITAAPEDPFKAVYTGIALTQKRALAEDEIKRFRELSSLCNPKLAKQLAKLTTQQQDACFYFLFSFFARGMSSIDMAYLKKANISGGKISYCRKKTGGNITISLSAELKAIIRYFAERTKDSPYVFPIIDDRKANPRLQYENFLRKQNTLLKELARLAKISKPVSTHWARHSWATIAKKNGAPTAHISEGLGHRDEKTTRIYLDSFGTPAIDKVCRLVNRAIS